MATDKPAPTQEEVEALIERKPGAMTIELHAASTLEWCNEVAAMLRRLAATVPQAGVVPRERAGMEIDARLERALRCLTGRPHPDLPAPQAAPERAPGGDDVTKWFVDALEAMKAVERHMEQQAARIEALNAQLPDGMKHCTIRFRECEKGHGWLTADNWVPFDCPTCAIAEARAEIARLKPDAERYDLFKRKLMPERELIEQLANCISGYQFDAIIDAVLAAREGKP